MYRSRALAALCMLEPKSSAPSHDWAVFDRPGLCYSAALAAELFVVSACAAFWLYQREQMQRTRSGFQVKMSNTSSVCL